MPAALVAVKSAHKWTEESPLAFTSDLSDQSVATITVGTERIVVLHRPGRADQPLFTLADRVTDQVTGPAINDHVIAFFVSHSHYTPAVWTLYVYNRQTSQLRKVTDNPGGASHALDGPYPQAILMGTKAYWVQGAGGDQLASVRQYDLATGVVSDVRTGHPSKIFQYEGHVYWMESLAPDALSQVVPAPGSPPIPPDLARLLPGASGFDYLNGLLVWIAPDGHTIRYYDHQTQTSGVIYRSTDIGPIENLMLVGTWLTWQGVEHPWALDRTTKTVFPLTAFAGFVQGSLGSLLIGEIAGGATAPKGSPTVTFDIPAADLPRVAHC